MMAGKLNDEFIWRSPRVVQRYALDEKVPDSTKYIYLQLLFHYIEKAYLSIFITRDLMSLQTKMSYELVVRHVVAF